MAKSTIEDILTDKDLDIPEGMRKTALAHLQSLEETARQYEELTREDPKLQYFNGRCLLLQGHTHGFICARSKAEAVRIGREAFGPSFTRNELNNFWASCWGTRAETVLGPQTQPGVWFEYRDRFYKFSGSVRPE